MSKYKTTRITIVDSLRGFALAGILICHMAENFIGAQAPESFNEAVHIGTIDYVADGAISLLLRGKFIALFSFLFGLSFFIQMDNGIKKGRAFHGRFLWRLVILMCIGYLHSLFYRGDILTVYAILGIFLVPFFRVNNKWILGLAALLFLGLGRYMSFFITHGASIWPNSETLNATLPKGLEYYEIIKEGSLYDVFDINAINGHKNKLNYQFGIFGRGYYTFAFFLVGLYMGRLDFFRDFRGKSKLIKKMLIWSIILLIVFTWLSAAIFTSLGEHVSFSRWITMIGLSAVDMANAALTSLYIIVFVLLYKKARFEQWLSKFAPYGRMALTNYFLQSVIATFVFYGWGLGYLGEIRQIYTLVITILFTLTQMWLSKLWLSHFYYGPLEWLWRSVTFFKIFPMWKSK